MPEDLKVETSTETTEAPRTEADPSKFDARTDLANLPEGARQYVERLRTEAIENRKEAQRAKQLADKLEQERRESEARSLAEQGKYKELYEKEKNSNQEEKQKLINGIKAGEVKLRLQESGAIDPDVVASAVDLTTLQLDESGKVIGAVEAVTILKDQKPHLFQSRYPTTAPKEEPAAPVEPTKHSTSATGVNPGTAGATSAPLQAVTELSKQDYASAKRDLFNKLRGR